MATITTLTENFETGPAGATITTGNTFFDSVDPTNPPNFSAAGAGIEGSLAMTNDLNASSVNRANFTAASVVWLSFYIKITATSTTSTAFLTFFQDTVKIGDLRILAGGSVLQIRSNNTARWDSTTGLALDEWHRIAVRVTAGTSLQLKVYSGANLHGTTASLDSTSQSNTNVAATATDNFRFGTASSDATLDYLIDRVRGDNATEPAAMVTNVAPTANAGPDQTDIEPYALVTLDGTGSSDSDGTVASYAWTQTAGPTVTLSSSTVAQPTFTAPPDVDGTTLTFSLVVTDNGGLPSSADTVDVGVRAHNHFTVAPDGTARTPYQHTIKT